MTIIDPQIISLIVEEERARKRKKESVEYGVPAVLYEEDYEEERPTDKPKSNRGVVTIDI